MLRQLEHRSVLDREDGRVPVLFTVNSRAAAASSCLMRNRLLAAHAVALITTLAAVAVAGSAGLETKAHWTVIVLGAIAAASSMAFAWAALRQLARLASELQVQRAARPREVTGESDLRSELAAIRDRVAQLVQGVDSERSHVMLAEIDAGVTRLDRQIDVLFDVRRIQAGTTRLHTERCDTQKLIAAAIEPLQAAASARGVSIGCERASGTVYVDVERIARVLSTLVSHAIQTQTAGAGVQVAVQETAAGARFSVSVPEGAGIAGAWANKLDIHLCSKIVEAHGGRLGFELAGPRAACWFVLPAEPQLLRFTPASQTGS